MNEGWETSELMAGRGKAERVPKAQLSGWKLVLDSGHHFGETVTRSVGNSSVGGEE